MSGRAATTAVARSGQAMTNDDSMTGEAAPVIALGVFMLFTSRTEPSLANPCMAAPPMPPPTPAQAPEAGRVIRMTLSGCARQVYYLYVPHRLKPPGRLFVTVHGISRNAREHAEGFAPLAERQGVVLVAPRFARRRFGQYQRLAPDARGHRPDRMLERILAEVRGLLDLPESPVYLFGYSGGGQFAHRYAMAHPGRVARAVIGAAGWYTFPDPRVRYPRGWRFGADEIPLIAEPDALRVPMAVIVGAEDVDRDPALNPSRRIDRQQGENRCERGRRWIAAMRQAARARGLATPYQFQVLPGVGHDFTQAMASGGMGPAVFAYLFGGPVAASLEPPCAAPGVSLSATGHLGRGIQ
ncbi:alpha/beta hydrolase [Thiocystis violacea]|uniref:alpha/beta hydrolase n=1 Tax=Thiocystis violacea TaxID=13725 RepID=UPI001908B301|nr:alpha/beta hydrolase [Thiocystis violacea]MBK1717227.1 hypothetical protein [Thiocystis violacea]